MAYIMQGESHIMCRLTNIQRAGTNIESEWSPPNAPLKILSENSFCSWSGGRKVRDKVDSEVLEMKKDDHS